MKCHETFRDENCYALVIVESQSFLSETAFLFSMEKLKSLVPSKLKQMVAHSTADDVPLTSSTLLDLFLNLQQFHQVNIIFYFPLVFEFHFGYILIYVYLFLDC